MGFVQRAGKDFVRDGKKILFSGIGIGSWLNLEHYMLGMPTLHSGILDSLKECFGQERADAFYANFVSCFFAEEDLAFLSSCGINLVRVPFHYGLFIDDGHPETWREEGFCCFDRLFAMARKYRIYVLPDLHAAPGGQNPDWHSDNGVGVPLFWKYRIFQDQAVRLWETFAKRYRGEEYLLGYDLLNEPVLPEGGEELLRGFYARATEAIRRTDENHLIFLEGDFYAMDFACLGEITDEQTALTFHYYPTVWDARLDGPSYPAEDRRKAFEEHFLPILKGMEAYERPMLCGEFGFDIEGHTLEHVTQMLEDILAVYERHGLSWVAWCYKDARFMGMVYPLPDTDWMRFADQVHEKWNHYLETAQAEEILKDRCRFYGGGITPDVMRALRFRQQTVLSALQKELLLKPLLRKWGWERLRRMPASFALSNCGVHEAYRELVRRHSCGGEQQEGMGEIRGCGRGRE